MQYHLNGFKPGNYQIPDEIREPTPPQPVVDLPKEVDVLIVGCGIMKLLSALIEKSPLTFANMIFGSIFGLFRGVIIAVAIIFLINLTAFSQESVWQQ